MEYARENTEAVQPQLSHELLTVPHRPPHPNPALTTEILAPLLKEQIIEAFKEMQKLLVSSTIEPVMLSAVAEGSSSQTLGSDRDEQRAKRELQLKLITLLETASTEVSGAQNMSSSETVEIWQKKIYPLIEQMLEFSKAGEFQVTDAIKRIKGQFTSLTGLTASFGDGDTTESGAQPESSPVPDMMEQITSFAADSNRQHKRQERNVLSALLYEPFSQFEESRLNELAISIKQRGYEIEMDPRDPVVGTGEDDTRLLSIFFGNRVRQWAGEIGETLVADLLDPISGLTVPDQEALQNHCTAIDDIQKITFRVNGTNSLDYILTIPDAVPLSLADIAKRMEELLAPAVAFERAFDFSHAVEREKIPGAIKVTIKIQLPVTESRYEPESFHLKKLALERLADVDIAERLNSLRDSAANEVSFSGEEPDFDPHVKANISLKAAGNIWILIDRSLLEELSPQTTLDLMRMATQVAQNQPTIRHITLTKPPENPFFRSQNMKDKVMVQLEGALPDAQSPLARTREALEKQRSAFGPLHPMQQLMNLRDSGHGAILQGALSIDQIPVVAERAGQLPSWICCVGARLKLLTLAEEPFSMLMKTIQEIKEAQERETIYLTELPSPAFSPHGRQSLRYVIYSDAEIPLAEIYFDPIKASVSINHFDTALFEDLCSRALAALKNPEAGTLRRTREIDERLIGAGLDLSAPLVQELTALSNSWAGREIPATRITDILDTYLFDDAYTISRRGDLILCLHHSENFGATTH